LLLISIVALVIRLQPGDILFPRLSIIQFAKVKENNRSNIFARFRSNVPPEDRVPLGQKLAYGAGNMVEHLTVHIPLAIFMPVFNIGLGLDPIILGMMLASWRIYDAILDPIMGAISDNTRSRWGRRRPYIVAGSILTALFFPLMWWVPVQSSETFKYVWIFLSGLLVYAGFTVWATPYYSLQLEMTPDYNERTNVSAYRAFAGKLITMAGSWVLAIASSGMFADASGEADIPNGMRWVSLGMAALMIGVGVLPGFFNRERYYEGEASKQDKQKFWPSLKQTIS
jgi:GPH family glycoside/pentoside/hexuronide:cation symporter